MPISDADRDHQCANLAAEISRLQTNANIGASMQNSPQMAMAFRGMVERNISYLRSRRSQIQCDVVRFAPTTPIIPLAPAQTSTSLSLDQCFAKCRELTKHTEAECFDTCRK
jgi:hypothetical protein